VKARQLAIGLLVLASGLGAAEKKAAPPAKAVEQLSQWHGFVRLDFVVAGRPCILVAPKAAAPGRPWIWRTEFFDHEPQVDVALLERGWHVAYMDAKDMYGGPKAMALFGPFYARLVAYYGLSQRVVLEGLSRGALYAVNFAATHPTRVAALYLDAPVLDILSWPGRNRESKEWKDCLAAYGLSEESLPAFRGNPINRVGLIANGKIPILVVAGDADTTVPLAENGGLLEKRYKELGGTIEMIIKPGVGHHPHSLTDPTPIVNFILQNAKF
jgi:pimeloyl-ACP methyl ester carboxylesterase